jgi:hypothetical protein
MFKWCVVRFGPRSQVLNMQGQNGLRPSWVLGCVGGVNGCVGGVNISRPVTRERYRKVCNKLLLPSYFSCRCSSATLVLRFASFLPSQSGSLVASIGRKKMVSGVFNLETGLLHATVGSQHQASSR